MSYSARYAPRYLVTVGGTEFYEYSGVLTDVVVDTTVEGADHFSFRLIYPFDHEHGEFDGLDWKTFKPGTKVEIEMGYGNGSTETVFVGEIGVVEPTFPETGPPSVQVSGFGPLQKLMQGANANSWEEKTIGDIVKKVASPAFNKVTVSDAKTKLDRVFQHEQSDYEFIVDLAEKFGFECFGTVGEFQFRPRKGGKSAPDPVASLFYGESLESIQLRSDSTRTLSEVTIRYWDPVKKEEIVGKSAADSDADSTLVYRVPVKSKKEATALAEAKAASVDSPHVEGTCESFGIPEIVAGRVVKIDGIGSEFANNYYVTDATHRMTEAGYRMTFSIVGLK